MRETSLFCRGWQFALTKDTYPPREDSFGPVELPHDWLIYDTKDLYKRSVGWYRHSLTVPDDGRRTFILFEGVYMNCRVYVNDQLAGKWKYGYTTFGFDITDLLREGENRISVRVDHEPPNSRWYSGAGIYRRVFIQRYEQEHFLQNGLYISADGQGNVTVTAEVERPQGESAEGLGLRFTVLDPQGKDCARWEEVCLAADRSVLPAEVLREGASYSVNTAKLRVESPRLWDIESPVRYTLRAELTKNGEPIDCLEEPFGFRDMRFTPDGGFFLNGRHVKLHGVCEHHDLGCLGAAFNRSAMKRKLLTLRTMGVNAIRTSHNPPAPELLELTDELGFLVLDELLDMWELKKTEYDYARFFKDWIRRDVASWIRRDRNHPCIIGWSIGNEIYDTHFSDRGQEITALLKFLVESHDPRKNAPATIGSNYMPSTNAQKCADILKIPGYNYAERLYDEHHAAHPDWCIYGSETSSVVSSRGVYHFPAGEALLSFDDKQCSSLGNSSPGWASRSDEANILADSNRDFCAGQFIWTGFDYIGEPTPYDTKNSYFGKIDTAGFPKDNFYLYKAAWTDWTKDPFIHLYPYWDWNEGQVIDLRAATNCPKAAIFFNGELVAEKTLDHTKELTLDTQLTYRPGEVTAVACDENGNEVARDVQRSFGDAVSLRLTADRTEFGCHPDERIFISVEAVDKDGNFVANASDSVAVSVDGPGRLMGLDNGDSTDFDQYRQDRRRLFNGRLLAVIAPDGTPGTIRVTVGSPLPETSLELTAKDCGYEPDGRFLDRVRTACYDDETVPIRKIELSAGSTVFSPDNKQITFRVRTLPENNTLRETVKYKLMTNSGISSPLGRITEADSEHCVVEAMGDGDFCLCAYTDNGFGEHAHLMSVLPLRAEGLGSAFLDPYHLISGGLYTLSSNATNGIEHGAAFLTGGGWFGFENVDFGDVGSDEIILPIFANYSTPVRIRVYDGTPDDGELLGDFLYDVAPIWMEYQSKHYILPRVLKGLHTITLASDLPYDVKGIKFRRRAKERDELFAAEALSVYGDKFTKGDKAVTDIGNNVMLNFGEFDFTERQPEAIVIKGRSGLPVNSIHVLFTGDTETRAQADFRAAEDYTERSFILPEVRGRCGVELVFLPGSEFDLMSIRFEPKIGLPKKTE